MKRVIISISSTYRLWRPTEPKDVAAPTVQNSICFAEPSYSIELIGVNNFIAKPEI